MIDNPEQIPTLIRSSEVMDVGDDTFMIKRVNIPVHEIWVFLKAHRIDPFINNKWPVSRYRSPLAGMAPEFKVTPDDLHLLSDEIEMCYIECPPVGGIRARRVVQENEDVKDPKELIHSHHTCDETYIVLDGELGLQTEIERASKVIINGKKGYQMDGLILNLNPNLVPESLQAQQNFGVQIFDDGNNGISAVAFTVLADKFHTVIKATPGTKYLVLKSPNANWNGEGDWSDKKRHPCEDPYATEKDIARTDKFLD